jgi:hypothetical protein
MGEGKLAILAAALTLLSAFAYAESAPQEMREKSIIIRWTEHRNQRQFGEANFRDEIVPLSMTIYVSSVGRPFFRFATQFGRHDTRNAASSEGVGTTGTAFGGGPRKVQFQSRSPIFTASSNGGLARRYTVSFNETFSACEAQIISAKLAGTDVGVGLNLRTRQPLEIRSTTVSDISCSVRNGNVFAE